MAITAATADDERALDGEGGGSPPEPEAKQPISIDLSEDSDDAPEPVGQEDKKSRRQQYREWRAGTKKLEAEIAELRGRLSAPQPVVVHAPQPREAAAPRTDPLEAELQDAMEQRRAALAALSAPNQAPEYYERFTKQYESLERKIGKVHYKLNQREDGGGRQQAQPENSDTKALMRSFPEIFKKESLRQLAVARAIEICENEGRQVDYEISERACREIYRERGIGQKPRAPTAIERDRHTSTASRPGTSAGAGSWTPTKAQERSALEWASHRNDLNEKQKIRLYHDKVLKPNGLA